MQTIEQLRSGELVGIRYLKLACGLTTFPLEILTLAESLEVLDLSDNAICSLPADFAKLSKLRVVFFSNNEFTEVPTVLARCDKLEMVGFKANRIQNIPAGSLPKQLRWLVLTDNALEQFPDEIGACTQLQKLMLAGNRLRALPEALANCRRLELLRIAANDLDDLPSWLLNMPRLSWLAYSGNSFGAEPEIEVPTSELIDEVRWKSLEVETVLGEGASGVIHRATMSGADGSRSVAVKIFKGTVTSDGFPASEMAASIGAGSHPNLIGVLGKVVDHPSGIDGMVMRLVDPGMTNLAGPPSLESCTRDIYLSSAAFDLRTVLRIACSIASVARHLHKRGILHGDLYAHNILYGRDGETLLGDFGAASVYTANGGAVAQGLERLEIRAFGCLLEELLDRCNVSGENSDHLDRLNGLKSACLSECTQSRPLFDEIYITLSHISALNPGRDRHGSGGKHVV